MAVLCVLALTVTVAVVHRLVDRRFVALYALAAAVHADGRVGDVGVGDRLLPGVRVFDEGPRSAVLADEQRAWLAGGRIPRTVDGTSADLLSDALLDLHVLTQTDGVTIAGWSSVWRYVWPRDSAFVASAFARTGHVPEAERLLTFLDEVQQPDGRFQARYTPEGGVPDERGVQLDGTGWALWALDEVSRQLPQGDAEALIQRRQRLLDRSTSAIEAMVDNPANLPPVSADYWEVHERQVTLATCAILLTGLRAASRSYATIGQPDRARQVDAAADRFQDTIVAAFAPDGYPRRLGGRASSVDLGVAFLLPPFATTTIRSAAEAWQRAPEHLSRPAGGLAPGGSWRRDGISWTPTTAAWAVTGACVDPRQAEERLRWLDRHRTSAGAIPEKVLADGSPAAVAPLAWSAAAVIIAADELDRGCS